MGGDADRHAGKTVFRYNEPGGITSLDPAFARNLENIWAVNQLFDGLVRLDADMQVQPAIAKKWRISPDARTYHFVLRSDARFHDAEGEPGRVITAADFVYSFERVRNPETASPGRWVFAQVASAADSGMVAVNDTVLQIRLREPMPAFLRLLTMPYCKVVPREWVAKRGNDFAHHPVGSGAFRFFHWKPRVKLVLHKNPAYYKRDSSGAALPYLDAVSISFLKDNNAAFLGMLRGDFDFISGLDGAYKDELLEPNGKLKPALRNRFVLQRSPFLYTEYIGITQSGEGDWWKDRRLYRALNLSVNRREMIRYVRNGVGIPAINGFIPDALLSGRLRPGIHIYRPDSARNLVKALHEEWGALPVLNVVATSGVADLLEYVQKAWSELGWEVKVNFVPAAVHREQVAAGETPLFRKSWIADYPDAQNFLSLFYSGYIPPAGPNYTRFSDRTFDAIYERAMSTADAEIRDSLYRVADRIVNERAPVVPLFYGEIIQLRSNRVKGLNTSAMNVLDLSETRLIPAVSDRP